MKQKINSILLIDDDENTNMINELILKNKIDTSKINAIDNGQKAIEYLQLAANGSNSIPNLIFLDINMPIMDGWKFMEEYSKFSPEIKSQIKIIMLSSSLNPDDRNRAQRIKEIEAFASKPLTFDLIDTIIENHLSDFFDMAS